jgi:Tfp pilus assembly protein PilP
MKLTSGVVALAITVGTGWAQNPNVITNTKTTLQQVQQKQAGASNQALSGPAKPAATAKPAAASAAPKVTPAPSAKSATPAPKTTAAKPAVAPAKATAAKPVAQKAAAPAAKPVAAAAKPEVPAVSGDDAAKQDSEDKKYSMTGKRDPFLSPVVSRQSGSGCSTGKKCLDIEAIALRGVVRSDAGMIAVVTNGLNKAYFLRENDPVFNGYVVKITGDSVVFKETFQDKLGKPFTRDVVKKITTPAV